jgi:hypothetical protein
VKLAIRIAVFEGDVYILYSPEMAKGRIVFRFLGACAETYDALAVFLHNDIFPLL